MPLDYLFNLFGARALALAFVKMQPPPQAERKRENNINKQTNKLWASEAKTSNKL